MSTAEELRALWRLVGLLPIASTYHLLKLAGNLVDRDEGIIEHRVSQLFARSVLDHFDLRVEVQGAEHVAHLERYCVVSTHASYLDWAVLLAHFPSPLRFIAKKELARVPVIGSFLRLRGVLIDRQRGIDARGAIRSAVEDGQPWPILIFPEGTRSGDGSIRRFRRGGLEILASAGLALVPVCVLNTFEALPRGSHRVRGGRTLRLLIGEPVRSHDAATAKERMAIVEQRVRALARS